MSDMNDDIEPQERAPAPIPTSRRTLVVNAKTYKGGPIFMVDRTSDFGNPFKPDAWTSRDACIDRFKSYFLTRVKTDRAFRARVLTLRGQTLGCWCLPKRCHAQIIADWLDAQV